VIAVWTHARLTPLPFEHAAEAMRAALRNELGAQPSNPVLALALAKCALETGRFRSIWNWNYGNVKAGETFVGQYCCIELNEVLEEHGKRNVVWFSPRGRLDRKGGRVVAEPFEDPPGHPQTRMRAFANRFDGAFEYVDFMARGAKGRFAPAFERMKAGDAPGMVHLMKQAWYFTADEIPYAAGVASLQREYSHKLEGKNPEPYDPPDHEWEALRASIIGGSWQRAQDAVDQANVEGR